MEGRKAEGRALSHHKNLAIAGVLGDGLDDEQRRHSSVVEFCVVSTRDHRKRNLNQTH